MKTKLALLFSFFFALIICGAASADTQITTESQYEIDPDISGDYIVYTKMQSSTDSDIRYYNLATKTKGTIANNYGTKQEKPAISGTKVVYTSNQNGNYDIWLKDIKGGYTQITGDTLNNGGHPNRDEINPDISGNWIVWQQEYSSSDNDIYGYNIATNSLKLIEYTQIDAGNPAVYGDYCVYQKENTANNIWDLYLYRFSTSTTTKLNTNNNNAEYPDIYGDYVVYLSNGDIWGLKISTNTAFPISVSTAWEAYPRIHGNTVVWEQYNTATGYDVYKYDIPSKTIKAVTTYDSHNRHPVVYGGKIIWYDIRNGNWDIYMNDLPDLVVQSLSATSTYGYKGKYVSVTSTVKNIGTLNAPWGFYTYFYLSTDTVISTADTYLGKQYYTDGYYPSFAPTSISTVTTKLYIPTTVAVGSYYIGAITDATNKVVESAESNNKKCTINKINVYSRPDLTITYLYGPNVAYKGRYVTFTATVKNIGTETAGGFYTRFYLSTNTVISSADKYLGQYYISSLVAGASKTIKITPRMPSSLATGYYYLGAITDATNTVAESEGKNNIKYRTTRIYVRW